MYYLNLPVDYLPLDKWKLLSKRVPRAAVDRKEEQTASWKIEEVAGKS